MKYEDICKKLNYDPIKDEIPYKNPNNAECYDPPNPFKDLNNEESIFLGKCLKNFILTGKIDG